uniref:Uncharacterized protein n=1 Tax=Macrostomum lignano TaxID=282301 RepID=A0A1I8IKD4_9PLAT
MLTRAGFVQSRAALQSAVADALQDILQRRIHGGVYVVGSYSEGWGNSLTSLNGKMMSSLTLTLYHLKNSCHCDSMEAEQLDYTNGHIFCSGFASSPAASTVGSSLRPATDRVSACRVCSYPAIGPTCPARVAKFNLTKSVLRSLRNDVASTPCHVVHAAPPNQAGQQLRVSTTFLEKRLLRSLNTVQGQLFVTLKYLIKKVIGR